MTTAQVVKTSVKVNNNSPIQDYVHPDDQTQPTFEIVTSHAKTYTNGFPLNGWNARLSHGCRTGKKRPTKPFEMDETERVNGW